MAAKTKIAIVEDDAALVQMYRMKFEEEGYEVATAGDGKAGLKLVEEFQPSVLLLDLMMPEMDGTEMLTKLRTQPDGAHLKVVVLTNVGEGEIPPKMRELDVKDFIVKADMTPRQVADRVKLVLAA